jgi:hypothetical protein
MAESRPLGMLHFRATEAWFSWLDEICLKTHRNRSQVLGLAVESAAEMNGWRKPPDRLPPDRRSAAKGSTTKKAKTAQAGG